MTNWTMESSGFLVPARGGTVPQRAARLAVRAPDRRRHRRRYRGAVLTTPHSRRLRAWNATMADAGWAAVSWPREYGGRGATVLEQLVYAEETTRARVPIPLNVIGMNNIAPAIMQYGTEAQKRTLLPRMMRADDIWCQGMSEPEAGSDLASLRTRAVRDGDDFVVNGQKIWTSLGHRADWCQLYVRTDPGRAQTQGHLVPDRRHVAARHRGPPARRRSTATPISPRCSSTTCGSRPMRLLGPLNGGWQVATTTLSHERAGAARLYAEMQVRLQELVADLRGAELDGRPALEDPPTLRRLGEIGRAHQVSRSAVPAVDLGDAARRRRASARPASPRRCGARSDRTSPPWPSTLLGTARGRRAGGPTTA